MAFIDILKTFVTSSGNNLISTIGNSFDKLFTSQDEKLQKLAELETIINTHNQKVVELAQEREQMVLADIANARALQTASLAQDDKFSKRFVYYLTIGLCLLCFAFDFLLFYINYPPANRDMINMVAGVINSTALASIISFFFGSSKGSDDKQRQINTMINANNPQA